MNKKELIESMLGGRLPEALRIVERLSEAEKSSICNAVKLLDEFAQIGVNAATVAKVIDYHDEEKDNSITCDDRGSILTTAPNPLHAEDEAK